MTIPTLTMDLLSDAIFNKNTPNKIHYFNFFNHPEISTLENALLVIDKKRRTLSNPNRHNFLCIEFTQSPNINLMIPVKSLEAVSASINAAFNDDLYIINLIYKDDANILHSVIVLSDIEKSLAKTSDTFLSAEIIHNIIVDALPDYQVESLVSQSIFVFNGETEELPYDGAFHLKCCMQPLNSPNSNR